MGMEAPTLAPSTVPAGRSNPDRVLVTHLRNSKVFRDYQSAYETTTSLPLALRPAGSFQLSLQDSKRLNPFCALMAAGNKTCAACLQMQQRAEEQAQARSFTGECRAGLTESSIPVRDGEHVLGFLQTGQVLLRRPTESGFRRIVSWLAELGATPDLVQLRSAYFRTRVLSRPQYESAVQLVEIFAQHLGGISNQLATRETHAEAPAITRARQFIAAHHTESISLQTVARHVNMSEYYFCKVFRKSTGFTFTDYLARLRVEHIKQMLLNPHMRVSEAAYAVGFQSLSQFNRVFYRVTKMAPSAYREKLHGSPTRPFRQAA